MIKEQGTCGIFAKINPDLLKHNDANSIKKQAGADEYPYPAIDILPVGYEPAQFAHAYPTLGTLFSEVTKSLSDPERKKLTPQVIILSAPISPDSDYNIKMLNHKFNEKYREIRLLTYIPKGDYTSYRGDASNEFPFQVRIHLPEEQAKKFYVEISQRPDLVPKLIEIFYPNLSLLHLDTNKKTKTIELNKNPTNSAETRAPLALLLN